MSRCRALLATLRIANGPSVVSNVWLGYVMNWFLWFTGWSGTDPDTMRSADIALLCGAGLLLYFAGNLANDWFDLEWDRTRRPERALPSGAFSPSAYLVAAFTLALIGTGCAFAVNPFSGITAIIIAGLVTLYTLTHKKTSWAVIPMGLCRAGLYVLGFSAFTPLVVEQFGLHTWEIWMTQGGVLTAMVVGMVSYIAALSLNARYESMESPPPGPRFVSRCLLALPVIVMPALLTMRHPADAIPGTLVYGIWLALSFTVFHKPTPRFVSALLAGIPLVDLCAAVPVAHWLVRNGTVNVPLAWTVVAVPLAAFVLGRTLQKVAPAT